MRATCHTRPLAGYKGTIDNIETKARATGETTKDNGVFDQTLDAGINLNWTIFDGFKHYRQLPTAQGAGTPRRDQYAHRHRGPDSNIAAEYYNYVQAKNPLENFRYAVSLSKERLRIVEERYHIGNFSRLDYQQAKVDFNADSAPIHETAGTAAHLTYPAERTHGKQRCRPAVYHTRQPHQRDRLPELRGAVERHPHHQRLTATCRTEQYPGPSGLQESLLARLPIREDERRIRLHPQQV
ncbi:TolC family protein [Bacteroides sp. CACC 737]|uniref:TolC family protein n=1 Tax=Bacteroides sp. CACC 737 TaxID=2755405 RepID=UPI00351B39F7